ncbi:MAG TPA: heme exporter protein CcmB [Candidatus Limnocylindria bacterium]|nr:heme exporter protein CcmB [Candidatus Limnocylindria bacterium]
MRLERASLVAGRELRAERAQPDGLAAALGLVAILVFTESLLVGPAVAATPQIAAALLWIALALATILALTRSFDRELEDDAIEALLALPDGRDALYAGKVIAATLLLLVVAAVGTALSVFLLDLDVLLPGHLLLVSAVGAIAMPPLVTLYVAISLRLRARALLVPLLALPALLPQLICVSAGVTAAITGDAGASLAWCALLVATALVSAVAGLTIGPAAIE